MNTFNRLSVLSLTATAVQQGLNNVLIRGVGLAQLVLNGDITEAEQCQLVGLTEKPSTDDKINYERFKYAAKLIKETAQVKHCNEDFKTFINSVDVGNADSLQQFQVKAALQGYFLTTGSAFGRMIVANFTEEHKTQVANAGKPVDVTPKAEAPKTNSATASAPTAPETVAAIQANPEASADLAAAMLAEAMQAGDIIGKTIAKLQGLDPVVALSEMAKSWTADRADLTSQIADLQAQLAKLKAPRQPKANAKAAKVAEEIKEGQTALALAMGKAKAKAA